MLSMVVSLKHLPPNLPSCAISASPPSGTDSLLDCFIAASFLSQRPWLHWQHELRAALQGDDSSRSSGGGSGRGGSDGGGRGDGSSGGSSASSSGISNAAEIAAASSARREALQEAVGPVRRWHTVTQDRLFGQLRHVWADDRPRTMLDLGCHAGHGRDKNVSDALIWLHHFNASGSRVLGVDAFEDFAIDLQRRFDHVLPYAGLQRVRKATKHFALTSADEVEPLDLFFVLAKQTLACCMGPPACGSWKNSTDHHCRITRQRLGLSNQLVQSLPPMPLPASSYPPSLYEAMRTRDLSRLHRPAYPVRAGRADSLWRAEMGGTYLDFVKIDVDRSWRVIGLEGMLVERAFAVLTIELDASWGVKPFHHDGRLDRSHPSGWGLTDADQLAWLAARHGYHTWLKLPCAAARPSASYPGSTRDEQRTAAWYWPVCVNASGACPPTALSVRSFASVGLVQDLMLLDSRLPELRALPAMAAVECKARRVRKRQRSVSPK